MDYVNVTWLDVLPCKMLLQSILQYTEEGVATQVWNYCMCCSNCQCLKQLLKSVHLNCLIAPETKCCPSNHSNFITHFMTCMLNIEKFSRITREIDSIDFSSSAIIHLLS